MSKLFSNSEAAFIDSCYQYLLNRKPDESGKAYFLKRIEEGATAAEILNEFGSSEEYRKSPNAPLWVPAGHFYSPYPSRAEINEFLERPAPEDPMAGLDMQDEQQVTLMNAFAPLYKDLPFENSANGRTRYGYVNSSYPAGDSIPLYSFIRHLKPKQIIEVGSGNSSCAILDTCELFLNRNVKLTFIEPYPDFLRQQARNADFDWARLITSRLQDVSLDEFRALNPGDILFIDSTHVSKLNSDVNFLFFHLLPALKAGVFIHIHDIFFPFEYPREWHQEGRGWNEQYILRAFLQYNDTFKLRFFNTYLMQRHRDWFAQHMPLCLSHPGGSIWLEKVK